jgi:hypothetical protein
MTTSSGTNGRLRSDPEERSTKPLQHGRPGSGAPAVRSQHPARSSLPIPRPPRDRYAIGVVLGASALSVASFIQVYRAGDVLSRTDAVVQSLVTRHVVDGGDHRLGGFLPPLPQLLALPFASIARLSTTGVAGALISMAAYVVTCLLLYRTVRHLFRDRPEAVAGAAALLAAAVFAVNPSVLYLQSTPTTEMLQYATTLGTTYLLLRWGEAPQAYGYLLRAAACALSGSLTAYDFWPMLPLICALVLLVVWHRERGKSLTVRRRRAEDVLLTFALVAHSGVVGWLVWNWYLSGSPLTFWASGNAAEHPGPPGVERASWHAGIGPAQFAQAVQEAAPWYLALPAVAGAGLLAAWAWRARRVVEATVVIGTLAAAPCLAFAVDDAPRLVSDPAATDVPLGPLVMLLLAVLMGCLVALGVGRITRPGTVGVVSTVLCVPLLAGAVLPSNEPAALRWASDGERARTRAADQTALSEAFGAYYDFGDVLMATSGNERFALLAVPDARLVDDNFAGRTRWLRALADPAGAQVRWVVMRCAVDQQYGTGAGRSDSVCVAFMERPQALSGYDLVHRHTDESDYRIYRMRG